MTTFRVSNASELITTVKQAQAGDTILLEAGNYGSVRLGRLNFASDVTLKSADTANPAHIEQLVLDKVSNLKFENVELGRALADGENHSTSFVSVFNSSGISFDGVHVHGSLDDNAQNDGYGMDVRNSSAIDIRNSEFEQLGRGIKFLSTTDINIVNNHVHDIRTDGMNFFQVNGVNIDRNYLHDFYPAALDHADAIQFMSKGATRSSTDIRLTNNVILQGDGVGTQGIFIKDENAGALPYERVHIANNLVYTSMYNGITVAHGRDVEIIGNTSLSATRDGIKTRIWIHHVDGARVEGNVTDAFLNIESNEVIAVDNVLLDGKPSASMPLPDADAGAAAAIDELVTPGVGYQPIVLPDALVPAPVEPVRVHDGFGNYILVYPQGASFTAAAAVEPAAEPLSIGELLGQSIELNPEQDWLSTAKTASVESVAAEPHQALPVDAFEREGGDARASFDLMLRGGEAYPLTLGASGNLDAASDLLSISTVIGG